MAIKLKTYPGMGGWDKGWQTVSQCFQAGIILRPKQAHDWLRAIETVVTAVSNEESRKRTDIWAGCLPGILAGGTWLRLNQGSDCVYHSFALLSVARILCHASHLNYSDADTKTYRTTLESTLKAYLFRTEDGTCRYPNALRSSVDYMTRQARHLGNIGEHFVNRLTHQYMSSFSAKQQLALMNLDLTQR